MSVVRRILVAASLGAVALGLGSFSASAAAETVQIVAAGANCTAVFCYVPAVEQAAQGDTVTWSNSSPDIHTVTRCTAAACSGQDGGTGADQLDSGGNIASGGVFAHRFNSPGTYYYYCAIHGYSVMHGEVVVAAPAAATPETPYPGLLLAASGLALAGVLRWRTRATRRSG